jgi:uncharacterized protein YbjT (DUF2867 family)
LGDHPKVVELVVDFDVFVESGVMPRVDHVFCSLGTTMAKAGSKQAFHKVDCEYPLRIGEKALVAGARHFILVSAASASTRSPFYYSRVKGEVEQALGSLGYRSLTIVRPSLILGDREEPRFGETLAGRFLRFAPRSVRPVHARDLASAMISAAQTDAVGLRIIPSGSIPRKTLVS